MTKEEIEKRIEHCEMMELWVRSQDKDILMKVDSLIIDEDKKCIFTHDKINSVGMTYTLGRYKTKERAFEVLDEIQNIIKINIIMTSGIYYHLPKEEQMKIFPLDNNEMCVKLSNQILVYEMPKE